MLICGKFSVMRVALRNKEKLSSMNSRKNEDQEMKAIYFKLSLRLLLITLREFEFEKLSAKEATREICFPSFEAHKKRRTLKFHWRPGRLTPFILPLFSSKFVWHFSHWQPQECLLYNSQERNKEITRNFDFCWRCLDKGVWRANKRSNSGQHLWSVWEET